MAGAAGVGQGSADDEAVRDAVRRAYPFASEDELYVRCLCALSFLEGKISPDLMNRAGGPAEKMKFALMVAGVKLVLEKKDAEERRLRP